MIIEEKPKKSFKDWYAANKAAVSARRKSKYHGDLEYRARVIAGNKTSREAARRQKLESDLKPVTGVVTLNGSKTKVELYRPASVAQLLGLTWDEYRAAVRGRRVPRSPIKVVIDGKRSEVYTAAMMAPIAELVRVSGQIVSTDRRWAAVLEAEWSDQSISVEMVENAAA